jgi:hypothetical protein
VTGKQISKNTPLTKKILKIFPGDWDIVVPI